MEEDIQQEKPKSSKKGWLIGGGVAALVAVIAVIAVFATGGQFFRGYTGGAGTLPIYYVSSQTDQYSCIGQGTKTCPFEKISDAVYQLHQTTNGKGGEIHVTGGEYGGLNSSGLENLILKGNWNYNFTSRDKTSKITTPQISITNAGGSMSGFTFEVTSPSSNLLIVDNDNSNRHFEIANIRFNLSEVSNNDMIVVKGDVELKNNFFFNSKADHALIRALNGPVIRNNFFKNNISRGNADGIIFAGAISNKVVIKNNIITRSDQGTRNIIFARGDYAKIYNNTIADNYATGSILNVNGKVKVYNNLLAYTSIGTAITSDGQPDIRNNGYHQVNIKTELISNNHFCDPDFESSRNKADDYRLGANSTCVEKGLLISELTNDFASTKRPQNCSYDIGAFEMPSSTICSQFQLTIVTTPVCGNGTVESGEQCDDGNTNDGDGCSSTCHQEMLGDPVQIVCGNSQLEQGEQCDDGNTNNGDGCSSTCIEEALAPPVQIVCGNSQLEQGEECDDGNTNSGDGCDSSCQLEAVPVGDDDVIPPPAEAACGQWSDVSSSDPEYDIWVYLCEAGVMKGYGDGSFGPDNNLVRAELLALAFRASDEFTVDPQGSNCFNDVQSSDWFATYACTAKDLGFVQGYSGNQFRPSNNVILAEGLKMFLGAQDIPYQINSDPNKWYYDMLQEAADNNWLPYTLTDEALVGPIELTRRKAANMIYRIMIYP